VTEKKNPKRAASAKAPTTTEPQKPPQGGADALKVLGPGVMKRPRRDPDAPATGTDEVKYTPSEQVFRRRS
jgi:hypothetical protein